MNITDEAVEAAYAAFSGQYDREHIRDVLDAAGPHIAAQALRDEADRVDALEKSTGQERVRAHMRAQSLRLRADEVEGK